MKTLALFLGTLTFAGAACAAGPAASAPAAASAPQTLASGMTIQHLIKGNGASPKATDTVQVHYRGTLADGTEFDSSYKRGQPISFPLNRVIPCWTEGVQAMQVGGKARLTCPPGTAYGARGVPGTIPPNATLTFEVVLLGVGG
ncbi:FKBP-type peptidyl-prolyl cis-trans isomerase [Cupriavidus taiwanensis]|uniref:Peptidyl-prolyl cis-trans isomerase n=1 Tax=Cupriavidus taiwanensis TaxID=164546 RepID=A0A975XED6_9BURK|nr:FKBP-type peptidyl-prolyl cis-trans isomerase [Cupriavidus taiwanensis]MDK3021088.1 FKBP-type peptidyl-prolyl cis-trans isomerase [Cupriavidus taiwanensis]NSX16611.1 FKBP-type peptidyl-prolyl cis-trans isomerase [Cupriavidus taiwanensis]SOY67885.1 Peptidyl-prolyl cis-trans isomerase [Cupriavidus taiwanensis]